MAERFASSKRIKDLDPDPEADQGGDPGDYLAMLVVSVHTA